MKNASYKHNKTTEKIYNYCLNDIFESNKYASAAMMATLYGKSELNPKHLGKAMSVDKTDLGIAGWIGKAKRTVLDRAKNASKSPINIDIQLDYLKEEITDKKAFMTQMKNATDIEEAVKACMRQYEKIAVTKNPDILKNRLDAANYYLELYGGNDNEEPIADDVENNLPYVVVIAKKIKLREKDSSISPDIGITVYQGEYLIYCCENEKKTWYQVYVGDTTGWISAKAARKMDD